MEKKMYNQPLTITTEVETMSVIMGATVSPAPQKPQEDEGGGEAGAPQRYPRF